MRSLAYEGLHQFIEEIQTGLAHVHDAITASYFEIAATTQTQS